MTRSEIEEIAELAHEVNRAYCKTLGDDSQLPWEDAPKWQRVSCIKGVEFHLQHPEAGPDASHNSWLDEKRATGWKYGPVKDTDKKEHPCFVPFVDLPKEQQLKDVLFKAVVDAKLGRLAAPPQKAPPSETDFVRPFSHESKVSYLSRIDTLLKLDKAIQALTEQYVLKTDTSKVVTLDALDVALKALERLAHARAALTFP